MLMKLCQLLQSLKLKENKLRSPRFVFTSNRVNSSSDSQFWKVTASSVSKGDYGALSTVTKFIIQKQKAEGRTFGLKVQVAIEVLRCFMLRTLTISRRVYYAPKHRSIMWQRIIWAGHGRPRLRLEDNFAAELEWTRWMVGLAQNRAEMLAYVNMITTSGSEILIFWRRWPEITVFWDVATNRNTQDHVPQNRNIPNILVP
jgi:hypothetical protein